MAGADFPLNTHALDGSSSSRAKRRPMCTEDRAERWERNLQKGIKINIILIAFLFRLCSFWTLMFFSLHFGNFVFLYFDHLFRHFSCVIFFTMCSGFFFCLAHLALQNVNKDYVIFSYFRNFVAKSDKKPKTKNGMNETKISFEGNSPLPS